jgi:hypothetical protein
MWKQGRDVDPTIAMSVSWLSGSQDLLVRSQFEFERPEQVPSELGIKPSEPAPITYELRVDRMRGDVWLTVDGRPALKRPVWTGVEDIHDDAPLASAFVRDRGPVTVVVESAAIDVDK